MARKKNAVPSIRIRLDGYQEQPITDPRIQKAVDWVNEMKAERKAFPMAWGLLVAALNGELGSEVQTAVTAGAKSTEEAVKALEDAMSVWLS